MSIARQLYDIFFEGCTHYAIAKINNRGALAYYTEEGVPTLELIEQHLDGKVVLGAYTLLPGNIVRWMAFDIDSKNDPEQAKEIARKLCDFLHGVSYVIEWSGNKGYHIIIFFAEPIPAIEAKAIGDHIRDTLGFAKSGDPHVEVYPKQDTLTTSNPLGNLLRLPLGQHPTTHNKTLFIDPYNGWEEGPEKPAEKLLGWRVSITQMRRFLQESDPVAQIIGLLSPYWSGGQRHEMALFVAGYFASLGWTEEAVIELVTELTNSVGEGDLQNLIECVTDTFAKVYKAQNVRGFDGLATILPSATLQQLTTVASTQTFSAALQVIDRIRLGKGQQFQKARTSARTIVSHLKEHGSLVQDDKSVYWLDSETRDLMVLGSSDWIRFMHSKFGLNPVDSFGKQVVSAVQMYSQDEAQVISVHKRAFWTGEKLYLNLGGPIVYVLDGNPKNRHVILNGDDGILFLNSQDGIRLPNLLESEVVALSPWSFLVDDISFSTGESVNASPEQQCQLLKAWILGTFFSQTMPTRPILTLLAPAGAGKTTAARRILRFLEGTEKDVLGLVQDKPDSLRASLVDHKILVLDNLEKTKATWLTDMLNRVSTGSHIEIRTLYKTNEVHRIAPDVFVIITATDMPFSEETVFTRMLPIELAPLLRPLPEFQLQMQLINQFEALWKGMIRDLDETVKQLKNNKTVEAPNESRLADFTVFCARIQGASFLDGEQLMEGLGSMISRQRQVLQQSSPFIQVLETWIRLRPDDVVQWRTMSDLYTILQRIANSQRMEWRWTSSQGLSRHVGMLEQQLVRHFGMSVRTTRQNGGDVKQYKFTKAMVEG